MMTFYLKKKKNVQSVHIKTMYANDFTITYDLLRIK